MTDSISILAEHVAKTMPDSMTECRRLLVALQTVIKCTHPAYRPICRQIEELDAVQRMQAELPLHFKIGGKTL